MRALGVAGDQGLPPGVEGAVEVVEQRGGLAVEGGGLVVDVHLGVLAGQGAQLFGLALDLGEALFEVEIGLHTALRRLGRILSGRGRNATGGCDTISG